MKKNTMTRDALFFLPAKVIEGILVILCSSLYTRIFIEDAVGAFNIVNTTITFSYLILCGWMANATTRYVGEEYQNDKAQRLFTTVSTIYLILCVAVGLFCIGACLITGEKIYLAGALMFFSYTLFQILNSALVQLGKIRSSIILSLTSASLKLLVAYVLVSGRSNYPSPLPAIFANTIADGIAGICAVFVLSIPLLYRLKYFSVPMFKKLLTYGAPLMGVSISVALLNMVDRYLVIGFFGRATFAVYSQNNAISSGIFTMITVGIMRGVYPAVLRSWHEGGVKEAKPLLDSGVRLYLLIALPAVAGLTAIQHPLSSFLFKSGYEAGAPVIGLTALAMFFMGLTEYANKAYELEASTLAVLQNSAVAAAVKVISSLILLPIFGFVGGALGSVVAFFTYFVITCLRVKKRFIFHVPMKRLANIIISAVLCLAAAYAVSLLNISSIVRLLLSIVAGGAAYVTSISISGEINNEINFILSKIRRKS